MEVVSTSRANLVYYRGYFTLPSSSLVGATRGHNNTDPNLTWIRTREREREWKGGEQQTKGGREEGGWKAVCTVIRVLQGEKWTGRVKALFPWRHDGTCPVTSAQEIGEVLWCRRWPVGRGKPREPSQTPSWASPFAYVLVENCTCYEVRLFEYTSSSSPIRVFE